MIGDELGWVVAATLAAGWLTSTAVARLRRSRFGRRIRHRSQRAARAECEAGALLRGRGYEVEAVQPTQPWVVWVDDEPHAVELRADMLVARGGRRYAVEVKTGQRAPQIETAATRRQLLEYMVAYPDVDGVLLVDMEQGRIQEVEFPGLANDGYRPAPLRVAVAIGLALGAGAALGRWWP